MATPTRETGFMWLIKDEEQAAEMNLSVKLSANFQRFAVSNSTLTERLVVSLANAVGFGSCQHLKPRQQYSCLGLKCQQIAK